MARTPAYLVLTHRQTQYLLLTYFMTAREKSTRILNCTIRALADVSKGV